MEQQNTTIPAAVEVRKVKFDKHVEADIKHFIGRMYEIDPFVAAGVDSPSKSLAGCMEYIRKELESHGAKTLPTRHELFCLAIDYYTSGQSAGSDKANRVGYPVHQSQCHDSMPEYRAACMDEVQKRAEEGRDAVRCMALVVYKERSLRS